MYRIDQTDLARHREWEAKQNAEQERAREAALKAELATISPLAPAIARGDVSAMRRAADIVARAYGFSVRELTRMPEGAGAYASGTTVYVPPITDAESLATRLHEFGHAIHGHCYERGLHQADRSVRGWWHCLACERDAWASAITLVSFSPSMWRHLHQALNWYRQRTPSNPETQRSVDQLLARAAIQGGQKPRNTRPRCLRELRLMMAR